MGAPTATKKSAAGRKARSGRPAKEFAGEVEERILEAARKVFLERGFAGASIEEIAETARAGKPTIYARYPNKQALFSAALTGYLAAKNERVRNHAPTGATLENRLECIAAALLREALTAESVGLTRLAIAEARRFSEFASGIIRMTRERGLENVSPLFMEAADAVEPGTLSPLGRERRVRAAASYFLDLIVLPPILRALSGENLDKLRGEIGPHVANRVTFFLATYPQGGIG